MTEYNPVRRGTRAKQLENASKRGALAFDMRNAGHSFEEIGKALGGITPTRARQIYLRHKGEWKVVTTEDGRKIARRVFQ